MTHDFAAAMLAYWSEFMNGALEAVERMSLTGCNHLEREIVVVAANFTSSHEILLVRAARYRPLRRVARRPGNYQPGGAKYQGSFFRRTASSCWARLAGLVPSS